MGFEPGNDYAGLTAANYFALLELDIDELSTWLRSNLVPVAGNAYYVFSGDQGELIEVLELYDSQGLVDYFTYLRSTWKMSTIF